MTHVERRVCQRFAVPEARVACKQHSRLPFRSTTERECVLMDLSRGGARFLMARDLKKKTRVDLEIRVSGDSSPLRLTGRVAWSWPHPGGVYQEVAVQFEPYGQLVGANSPQALESIVELERRFCTPNDRASGWPLEQGEPSIDPSLLSPSVQASGGFAASASL